MSAFLFLQRFDAGSLASMPYNTALDILSGHGKIGNGRGDAEVTFAPDTIGSGCTVVGDIAQGISCIGIESPRYDEELRRLVWECMTRLRCAVFDDTLQIVYTLPSDASHLPDTLVRTSQAGVRRIGSTLQLWPQDLESVGIQPTRPALLYTNINRNGPNYQFFDYIDNGNDLYIEFDTRAAACNAGTLKVFRNLELRVDAALNVNPGYRLFYRYSDPETSLAVLKSPRITEYANPATIVSPMQGETPDDDRFVCDREVFWSTMAQAGTLVKHVADKYQRTLTVHAESISVLEELLQRVHLFWQQEQVDHGDIPPSSRHAAMQWAIQAGCYLGNVLRRDVGGQWGYLRRGLRRLPALRLHSGRMICPHLLVLDRIINGPAEDIATHCQQLAQNDTSASPRELDLACNIPVLANILRGYGNFKSGGLPREEYIPRQHLDFSLGSLAALDAYLIRIARQIGEIPGDQLSNLVQAAGAYLGEVIRSHAKPGAWHWVNYDDFVRTQPDFATQRPRELGFLAFLDSAKHTAYPLQQVSTQLSSLTAISSRAYTMSLLEPGSSTATPDVPAPETLPLPQRINAWPTDAEMERMINEIRTSLTNWRRMAHASDYAGLQAADPGWLVHDKLGDILGAQKLLLEKGMVVWAGIVQANNLLFSPGPDDCPGALAYSPEAFFDPRPQALRKLGSELFAYKENEAPPALQRIGALLADEVERAFDIPLPDILTDRKVLLSTFMAFRKHLPDSFISGAWFPILIHPTTHSVMIVPRHFWPESLITLWRNGQMRE